MCNITWFYNTLSYQYLYTNCILVIWHPEDGQRSDWNSWWKLICEHIYKCAFVGLTYKDKMIIYFTFTVWKPRIWKLNLDNNCMLSSLKPETIVSWKPWWIKDIFHSSQWNFEFKWGFWLSQQSVTLWRILVGTTLFENHSLWAM
jgi:hypothetical protein